MPAKPKKLKKLLKEKLPEEKLEERPVVTEGEIDSDVLSKVIERMKEKYEREGVERKLPEVEEKRGMLEYGAGALRIKKGAPKELMFFETSYIRGFAKFYDALKAPLSLFSDLIARFFGENIRGNLIAANMVYSLRQYLSLVAAVTSLIWLLSLFIILSFVFMFNLNIGIAILLLAIIPLFCVAFAILIPSSRAQKIAVQINRELPFALRHMSTEIRAGISIFKVMESVAGADYGPVSDGFKNVLFSIEKGVPTEEALQNWASKTKSDGLKRAIYHLVRALRTGGNLSDIMVTIAEDVSFEHRTKISEYVGKLSLMGLFLLMVAIVFPVMLTILTAIGSSPQIGEFAPLFTVFTTDFLIILYFLMCPVLILIFIMFAKSSDPG